MHDWDDTLKSREEHREYAAPLRTPEGLRAFYRIWARPWTPFVRLSEASHFAHVDATDRFLAAVEPFLTA